MGDESAKAFNSALKSAGISPSQFKVTSCAETGPCEIEFKEKASDPKTQTKTFQQPEDFFGFVDQWLLANPSAASARLKNSSRLFRSLGGGWVLVDADNKSGAESFLYRSRLDGYQLAAGNLYPGKIHSERLKPLTERLTALGKGDEIQKIISGPNPSIAYIEYLSKITWKDLGLSATSQDFEKETPGLKVKTDPALPAIFGPWATVSLDGHSDVTVPWTDNYLMSAWYSHLGNSGLKYFTSSNVHSFSYEGLLAVQGDWVGNNFRLRLFGPLGQVEKETLIAITTTPSTLNYPDKGLNVGTEYVDLVIHGKKYQITTHFPDGTAYDVRLARLQKLNDLFNQIPSSIVTPLLKDQGKEKKIYIDYAEPNNTIIGGDYSSDGNSTTLPQETGIAANYSLIQKVFHEVGGHAYSDFKVPDDNHGFISDPERSAIRDYYVWRLMQTFSLSELKAYGDATFEWNWIVNNGGNLNAAEQVMVPFRSKASKAFVSDYAVEGGGGISSQANGPEEYFAENMRVFLFRYNRIDYAVRPINDPFLKLLGLDYLFQTYQVDQIGKIKRAEVFSKMAFKETLGVDLDTLSYEEAKKAGLFLSTPKIKTPEKEAPKEVKPPVLKPTAVKDKLAPAEVDSDLRVPGFSFSFVGGWQHSSYRDAGSNHGFTVGFQPGYQGKHFGIGAILGHSQTSFDVNQGPYQKALAWDLGGYAQWIADVGLFTFFLEPSLGYRNSTLSKGMEENDSFHAFWLGAGAGVGIGGLNLKIQDKVNLSDPGQFNEVNLSLMLDLPTAIRSFQK